MFAKFGIERNHFLLALIPWVLIAVTYFTAEIVLGGTQGKGLEGPAVTTLILGFILAVIVWFVVVIVTWVRKGGSYAGRVIAASFILWVIQIIISFAQDLIKLV